MPVQQVAAVEVRRPPAVAAEQPRAAAEAWRRAMAAEAWAAQLAVWADGPPWSATAASAALS